MNFNIKKTCIYSILKYNVLSLFHTWKLLTRESKKYKLNYWKFLCVCIKCIYLYVVYLYMWMCMCMYACEYVLVYFKGQNRSLCSWLTDNFKYIFCLFKENATKPYFSSSFYVVVWGTFGAIVITNFIVCERTQESRYSLRKDGFTTWTRTLKIRFFNFVSIFENTIYSRSIYHIYSRCFFIQCQWISSWWKN